MFLSLKVQTQSNNFKSDRTKFAAINVGLNGLFGGVGSLINKKDNKTNFKTFLNGFYKGAIGGAVTHIGLSMSHLIDSQKNIAYAWPARFVNSMGSSIIQNAADGDRMFERLHFNLFISRLEYYPYQKKFSARLFTSSLYGIAVVGSGNRFDLGKSLKSGVLFFESDGRFENSLGSGRATGQVSSVGMRSDITGDAFYDIFAEEIAHIQQYDRKVVGNSFVSKLDSKWKNNSRFYKKMSKYIYFDLNGPLFWMAYKIADSGKCNYFEQEAVNYSNRRINPCN
ncbi:hypothetical protein [Polaribacter porphyrae]|uniref:hypothetical protein n=1 Tax=Polaribacter porphyrae TaxID=1137780 RepID=UPI0011B0D14D|nr:hypothetical protein [Polaribacter porphyrae]